MSRPIFLGNGSMLVGLDDFGLVHDFYYPYVGLENHSNARNMHHRIGIHVDGKFSWMDSGEWDIKINYEADAMISNITAVNHRLKVGLEFHDFVDANYNAFCRNIHVINNADTDRDVKVFMHQVFKISDSNRGDTALYEPNGNYILDYKGRRCFLIYGQKTNGESFDQYSIGVHGIEGKQGTYADAEDGELSGHPVEHGMVDSTLRFNMVLPGLSSKRIHYWVVAAGSHDDALKSHKALLNAGFQTRYEKTQEHWRDWLDIADKDIKLVPNEYRDDFKKSLFIMKSHIDKRGSILASGDSEMLNYARDNYSYCWPRDAAFVLWPLIRLGYQDEPKAFFEFARDVLSEEGMLMHKFQPDRAIGSSWHPLVHKGSPELAIQEDETAIVIFMMYQYLMETEDEDFVRRFYDTLIQPAANFMEHFIDTKTKLPHASYDLWEEKFLTNTYTVAVVYAGLRSAAKMAERFEYPDDAIRWQAVADDIKTAAQKVLFNEEKQFFHKGYLLNENGEKEFDTTIDVSSLYGVVMFQLFPLDSEMVVNSVKTLEDELLNASPSGGLPRYEYDQYCRSSDPQKGNPWFVTTLWLAQMYIEMEQPDKARELLDWSHSHMLKSGVLSEQIDPVTSEFRSVVPLIWSQAEFVNTVIDSSE